MDKFDIYDDIAKRTGGSFLIGVVGPVRTGKSTFIKRFMDLMVIPYIEDEHQMTRAKDELPQSSSGKTIMTTEPKFVPAKAVEVKLSDNLKFNARLIDCVGYVVSGAEGNMEDDAERMVNTPWYDEAIPFTRAAEIGTEKVIKDHSTIGIVVTTDGSFTDIPRANYVSAEERVVGELKELGKPFVILLNSERPFTEEIKNLKSEMEEKYDVPVIPINCSNMKENDINSIFEKLLYEFPIKEIKFNFPQYIESLDDEHWLKKSVLNLIKNNFMESTKITDIKDTVNGIETDDIIKKIYLENTDLGKGSVNIDFSVNDGLFYKILSETIAMPIENDYELISTIRELAKIKKEYDRFGTALGDLKRKGYGIVSPEFENIVLEEPKLYKQGSRYGIKLKAKGESINLIKVNVETEVSPIVGSEEQSKEYIQEIINEYKKDENKIWDLNIFGRTLSTLVNEGMNSKINKLPEDTQMKLQETLQKIVNEGKGGMICIML